MEHLTEDKDVVRSVDSVHDADSLCYRAVYDAVEASIDSGGPLRSALFWEWLFPGEARTERGVETNDTAFQ